MRGNAAVNPAQCSVGRFGNTWASRRAANYVVERHHNVRTFTEFISRKFIITYAMYCIITIVERNNFLDNG